MRIRFRNPHLTTGLLTLLGTAALAFLVNASGWPPKIDYIQSFQGTNVLIHFDTEANFTYELQYTEMLTNGVPGPFWTNLYVAESALFFNHYVVLDTGMKKQRFYRLHAYR